MKSQFQTVLLIVAIAICGFLIYSYNKKQSEPVITSEQFEKAKEYIKAGGKLEAIKSKYKLTATTENALLNEQKAS